MRRDSGLTLVELMVTVALLAGVFLIIGTVFVSMFSTQRIVSSITTTTSSAQQTAALIEDAVRNSSAVRVSASGGNELLVTRSASESAVVTWSCVGWYYDGAADQLLRKTTADGTTIAAPTNATELATWKPMLSGVTPRATTIFALDGSKVTIAFDAAAPGQIATAIQTTAVKSTGVTGVSTC